jgi:spermidine synthase
MNKQRFYFKSSPETGFYWDGILLEEMTSPYQKLAMIYNEEMGNTLILDGYIMVAQADEHQYHELIVHPACTQLQTHHNALIIGGGDGLCAEETLKYNFKNIDLVEIDQAVSIISQKYFHQQLGDTFNNPRLHTHYQDALQFFPRPYLYDFIALDLQDPAEDFMHSHPIYSGDFYSKCKSQLAPNGIMVTQVGCPYLFQSHFLRNVKMLQKMFKHHMVFGQYMRCYGTYQYFIACSDSIDFHHPNYGHMQKVLHEISHPPLKLYNLKMHESMLLLNNEIKNILLK